MRASARELGTVDDVAAIGRQLDAAALFHRRGARLGKLPGDAADLDDRRRRRIGEHHRHLQEQAEEIADVVGAVLGEALGAIAALQQKGFAGGDLRQGALEIARLAGENERRKTRQLRLDLGERFAVRVAGHLHDRSGAPGVGAPFGRGGSLRHASLQAVTRARRQPACAESIFTNSGYGFRLAPLSRPGRDEPGYIHGGPSRRQPGDFAIRLLRGHNSHFGAAW